MLWRCWLGGRKGIRPVKTEQWGAGMVIWLARDADLHMAQLMLLPLTVSCFSKIQIGFTFLVPAHLGSPGKRAVKRVCVCVNKHVTKSQAAAINHKNTPVSSARVWMQAATTNMSKTQVTCNTIKENMHPCEHPLAYPSYQNPSQLMKCSLVLKSDFFLLRMCINVTIVCWVVDCMLLTTQYVIFSISFIWQLKNNGMLF